MPIDLTTPCTDLGVWLIIEATTDPAERLRVATDPTVVALVERAATLPGDQRRRISQSYNSHFSTYRTAKTRTRHRVRHAGGPTHLSTRALDERIHEILDCPGGDPCTPHHTCDTSGFTCAVTDAIFAHLAREHLSADEMRLFTAPWVDGTAAKQPAAATAVSIDAVELPSDELYAVADRIEAALQSAGRNGLTPSAAGRAARVDTTTATNLLRWMVAHRYAHTDNRGAWSRYYAGRAR